MALNKVVFGFPTDSTLINFFCIFSLKIFHVMNHYLGAKEYCKNKKKWGGGEIPTHLPIYFVLQALKPERNLFTDLVHSVAVIDIMYRERFLISLHKVNYWFSVNVHKDYGHPKFLV